MDIGIVGLGRMGANMARRLARGGARVLAWDRERAASAALKDGPRIECVEGLAALATRLEGERVIQVMLPVGVPAPVITMALMARFSSQGRSDYARRLLAQLRARFGGHPVQHKR